MKKFQNIMTKVVDLFQGESKKCYDTESCHNQQFESEKMLSNYTWDTKRALDQNSSLKYTTFVTLQAYSNLTKFS